MIPYLLPAGRVQNPCIFEKIKGYPEYVRCGVACKLSYGGDAFVLEPLLQICVAKSPFFIGKQSNIHILFFVFDFTTQSGTAKPERIDLWLKASSTIMMI